MPRRPSCRPRSRSAPVDDFDFDAAILFSDLLFPLEALGFGLSYDDGPPKLDGSLTAERLGAFRPLEDALRAAGVPARGDGARRARGCRADKGLIGFVGGPWTLFVYAVEGTHAGALDAGEVVAGALSRVRAIAWCRCSARTSALQFDGGADVVMVFDTAAGELAPDDLRARHRAGPRARWRARFRGGSATTRRACTRRISRPRGWTRAPWAGLGVDWRWDLARRSSRPSAHGLRAGQLRSGAAALTRPRRSRRAIDDVPRAARARSTPRRPPRLDLRPWARRAARHAGGERAHVRRIACGRRSHDDVAPICSRSTTCRCRGTRAIRRCRSGTRTPTTDEWRASLDRARSPRRTRRSSVYVHLPFCESLCTFCGCNTVITRDHGRDAAVRRSRAARARRVSRRACRRSARRPVCQMHLGGGTPTFLSPATLGALVDGLVARLPARAGALRGIGRSRSARDDAARISTRCARAASAAVARRPGLRRRGAAARQPRPVARQLVARPRRATRARAATSRSTSI